MENSPGRFLFVLRMVLIRALVLRVLFLSKPEDWLTGLKRILFIPVSITFLKRIIVMIGLLSC